MQWDATANAGFSRVKPWLPLADDFLHENVRNVEADTASILSLYKALTRLRRNSPELIAGAYEPLAADNDLLIYRRRSAHSAIVVILNLGSDPVSLASDVIAQQHVILLSTFMDRTGERLQGSLELRGNEGVIIGSPSSARQ